MRITELRSRMNDYFSDADTYSRDIIHSELKGQTVNEALIAGQDPGEIWKAIVQHNPEMSIKFR
jgi:hypothetical protein